MRIIQYSNHEQARLHRVFASLCSENEQRRVERNTAKFAYKFSGKCTLRGVVQVGGHFKQFDREGEREITRYSTARCSRRRVKRMDTFCPIWTESCWNAWLRRGIKNRGNKSKMQRSFRIISKKYRNGKLDPTIHPLRVHPSSDITPLYRFHPLRRPDNPANREKPVA